jgi:hypothetical protein
VDCNNNVGLHLAKMCCDSSRVQDLASIIKRFGFVGFTFRFVGIRLLFFAALVYAGAMRSEQQLKSKVLDKEVYTV